MTISTATTTATNSDGVVSRWVWYFATNADAAAATTITCPFTPRVVELHNLTDRISDLWVEGMASASSLHSVAAGTRTLETTNGAAVSGGSITFTATTMVASKQYVIICER
jgi:hypothetical protein